MKKNPVSVRAEYCGKEILSVGRFRSKNEAPEMSHLLIGAQKCTVNGPAGASAMAPRGPPERADLIRPDDATNAATAPPATPAFMASSWTASCSPVSSLWLMAR